MARSTLFRKLSPAARQEIMQRHVARTCELLAERRAGKRATYPKRLRLALKARLLREDMESTSA